MTAPEYFATLRRARLPRPLRRLLSTDLGLPLACGLLYLAVGAWLAVVQEAFSRDGPSRTASAIHVVLGRAPHLAATGFVWNPLPPLAQVPHVPLLDRLGLVYLAGPAMSAAFAAAAVWVLDRLFRAPGLSAAWRVALLLLYALNPLILFYAVIGLSEAPFLFFLLGALAAYARWTPDGGPQALVVCAAATAAAFLVRY